MKKNIHLLLHKLSTHAHTRTHTQSTTRPPTPSMWCTNKHTKPLPIAHILVHSLFIPILHLVFSLTHSCTPLFLSFCLLSLRLSLLLFISLFPFHSLWMELFNRCSHSLWCNRLKEMLLPVSHSQRMVGKDNTHTHTSFSTVSLCLSLSLTHTHTHLFILPSPSLTLTPLKIIFYISDMSFQQVR